MGFARAETILLLCAEEVSSRLRLNGKTHREVAEWCLVSNRQVWNWCHEDTNISVSNLFNLADFLGCRPEELLTRHPMPEKKE